MRHSNEHLTCNICSVLSAEVPDQRIEEDGPERKPALDRPGNGSQADGLSRGVIFYISVASFSPSHSSCPRLHAAGGLGGTRRGEVGEKQEFPPLLTTMTRLLIRGGLSVTED